MDIEARLQALEARGVVLVDRRQVHVDLAVNPENIAPGVVLHPGTRLQGAGIRLAQGVEIGREGPATVVDCALGPRARVDSGYARGAVLLRDASLGAGAHVRPGTLLEEEASTAHTVGLKHTILLSFVTVGSLVNLCDCFMGGGTSRRDHSEVGSGYIHFNFTPWGRAGDKATPSLVGDAVGGVFLRRRRIFLGGSGGMVGPRRVGYGAVAAAGQVLRRDLPGDRIVLDPPRAVDRPHPPDHIDEVGDRGARNVEYVTQLVALRVWYRHVRLERARTVGTPDDAALLEAALAVLDEAIAERVKRLNAFLEERGVDRPSLDLDPAPEKCPLPLSGPADHVEWVQGLSSDDADAGEAWLREVTQRVLAAVPAGLRPGAPAD